MRKLVFLVALAITASSAIFTGEVKATSSPTDACGFTFDQGLHIGRNLGSTETFYGENWVIYRNTLLDFNHCSLYTLGVQAGYKQTRYLGEPVGGGPGPIIDDPVQ
ncbi:MAG TPA: hypothetical protein DCE41_17535 [Cytophagales bacterium]|nr:hypothetical protein [Cytophagales bacterium]HAA23865.1 hypothetical protein [Cytophagales bacterium]HAP64451.1 hypothetical protein [Cytophagales bacterium]